MIIYSWSIGVVLFVFLFQAGCSNHVPLRGTVTFSDDGAPLPNGMVIFEAGAFSAVGPIKPDGTYRVGSLKENDGIPPRKISGLRHRSNANKPATEWSTCWGAFGRPQIYKSYNIQFGIRSVVEEQKIRFSVDRISTAQGRK